VCDRRAAVLLLLAAGAASASTLGDPMRPAAYDPSAIVSHDAPVQRVPEMRLESTIIRPGRPVAVISGRSVTIGDDVDGATVAEIRPGVVALVRRGARVELTLAPAPIKRPPAAVVPTLR
jgi:hypothetical protein